MTTVFLLLLYTAWVVGLPSFMYEEHWNLSYVGIGKLHKNCFQYICSVFANFNGSYNFSYFCSVDVSKSYRKQIGRKPPSLMWWVVDGKFCINRLFLDLFSWLIGNHVLLFLPFIFRPQAVSCYKRKFERLFKQDIYKFALELPLDWNKASAIILMFTSSLLFDSCRKWQLLKQLSNSGIDVIIRLIVCWGLCGHDHCIHCKDNEDDIVNIWYSTIVSLKI